MPGAQSNRLAGSIHYMVVSEEECTSLTFIGNVHARQSSALMNFTFVVEKTHLIKKDTCSTGERRSVCSVHTNNTFAAGLKRTWLLILALARVVYVLHSLHGKLLIPGLPVLSSAQKSMSQPSLSVFSAVNSMSSGSVSWFIYTPTRTPRASVRLLYHNLLTT